MKKIIALILAISAILTAEVIKMATEEYPPYEYTENGVTKGMDVDIINAVSKHAGLTNQITFLPWSRCLLFVEEYKESAIFSILKTPEREKLYQYSTIPLYSTKVRIYATPRFTKNVNTAGDLEGLNVGAVRGNLYGDSFDKNARIEKDLATDGNMLMNKLVAGRYDLIIAAEEVGSYYIKKYPQSNLRMMPVEISSASYYIAFAKTSKLFSKFNESMKILEKNGELKKIRTRYKSKP